MKRVKIETHWPIRVLVSQSGTWGQIKAKRHNVVLHTGSIKYIKRVAREKFDTKVEVPTSRA